MSEALQPVTSGGGIVGRDAEMRTVRAAVDGLRAGRGGFLQVVGEPGIGKTFLLATARELATAAGIAVISGRAAEFERQLPFQLIREALHDYGDDELRSAVLELPGAEPDSDRLRLFREVRQLLVGMARTPLVMLLDDAHWADPGSIDFIDFLSRRPMAEPLLVVVSHRDRQAPAQLRYALARNTDHGAVTRIELGPLTRAEAGRLVGGRPGSRHPFDLYETSRGNPLYLLTLDRGAQRDTGRTGGDTADRLESLILGETMSLSEQELAVASTAAVLGDPFSSEVLAAVVTSVAPAAVDGALGTLIDRDLIRPGSYGGELEFRHPLVRRAIYNRAAPAWRVGVHRRALALLTTRGAAAAELSHHIEHGGSSWSPELDEVLSRAGQESMSTSPLTAAHWYRIALRMLPAAPEFAARRFELGYLLARALGLGGRYEASRDLLHQILHAETAGDSVNRSAAVVLCAHAEQRLGRYPEAIALLRTEVARLGSRSSPERIGLALELGLTTLLANDYPAARAEISWACEAARESGDLLGEATALAFSAFGEICVGHTAVARAASEAASHLVDGLPDSALAGEREALCMLGWAEMLLERFADAERHLARGRAIIARTGQSHGLPHVLLGQSLVRMFTGRLTKALDYAEQAEDAAHLVGSDHLLGIVLAIRAPLQIWVSPLGQVDAALTDVRRATALFTGSAVNSWWARTALLMRGLAELLGGDPRACVELVLRAGGPDLKLLGAPLVPEYAEILVGALIKLADLRRAAHFTELAGAVADRLDLPGQSAHAARARGLMRAVHGDHEAALVEFARADAGFAVVGKSADQARTAVFAARSLGRLGRRDEAVAALSRSSTQAAAGGARWLHDELDRVRESLTGGGRRAGGGSPAPATVLAALTNREREVAVLAGDGRSNRQIATQLRLSERTVEAHLASVYRKLGATSRVALATLLVRERAGGPRIA